ncbi:MAG: hypothetical protein WBL74_07835, partial [Novosphingobium sp.]|uniref:hypothetical protein n=1 Tax=Novosphingobium sp. TaxID=1874826 RepID=UPI003C7C6DFC
PPQGTPMHWSRLVDAPLALVIVLLTPLLGSYNAETVALVLVPMVTLGCVMGLVMRIAASVLSREAAVMAGVCAVMIPAVLAQMNPLRIDHHGWQIACVLLAAASPVIVRGANRAALLAGLAFALSLSISIEALPIAAAYGAILAAGWVWSPGADRRIVWFMASLAVSLEALFLLTRGPAAFYPWCDSIAPAHIAFFLIAAAGIALAARFGPVRRGFALGALAVSGAIAAVVFARMAPACLGAPFGALDPLVIKYWYGHIAEGNPVWRQGLLLAAVSGLPVVAALIALLRIRQTAPAAQQRFLSEYLLLFVAAMLTGMMVWRSIAFAGALGALGLGWLLSGILVWVQYDRTAAERGELPKRYLTIAAVVAVLTAMTLWPVPTKNGPAEVGNGIADQGPACDSPQVLALLNRLPAQTVFASLDISPAILATSRHSVVASNHHRANLAIRDVMLAFLSGEAKAHQIVAAHRATLLVVCTGMAEPGNYLRDAPRGLMADITAGRTSPWLEPVALGQPASLKVFRVVSQP